MGGLKLSLKRHLVALTSGRRTDAVAPNFFPHVTFGCSQLSPLLLAQSLESTRVGRIYNFEAQKSDNAKECCTKKNNDMGEVGETNKHEQ